MITMPFVSGNSQAVRLPKAFAFEPNIPVKISRQDNKIILEPVQTLASVPELFAQLGKEIGEIERDELTENNRQW